MEERNSGWIKKYFVFSVSKQQAAPADGKINLKFLHEYVEDGSGWAITVYKYTGSDYIEFYSTEIHLDYNENITLPYVGAIKNTTYYILVEGRAYYPATESYTLETSFIKSDYYEKENNESYAQATRIVLNNSYGGILNSGSDCDYYRIKPIIDGKISVKFKHKYRDSGDGWTIRTFCYYDGGYSELSGDTVCLNSDESIDFSIYGAKKGRIYYIVVSERGPYPALGENYTLDVRFDVPKPSSVSAKSSTSSISLSWKKVSGVSGYEVQMKNGKTYKAVAATSKTNAAVKKLKTGTKYTFRVRAYNVISGVKYYSGWTTFSAATAPAAPSLKATPGTKSATLKAGKQAATGFEIYRASSKNGKFKKIATVKGSSLSYKNKSLKSKSTYYYKVRAYVSVDGVKYYSAYSSVKSVKAK